MLYSLSTSEVNKRVIMTLRGVRKRSAADILR